MRAHAEMRLLPEMVCRSRRVLCGSNRCWMCVRYLQVGFNMRKVTKGGVVIKLWDLGGQVGITVPNCPDHDAIWQKKSVGSLQTFFQSLHYVSENIIPDRPFHSVCVGFWILCCDLSKV